MPRRRRLPRAAYPHAQERQYAAQLGALVDRAWGGGTDRITAAYERELRRRKDELHVDARTIPGPLSIVVEGVSIVFGRLLDKQGELVPVGAGAATAEANAAAVVGQLGAVIAVDPIAAEPWLGPVLEAWRASNVALIRGLGPENGAAVEDLVRRAWEEGQTTDWLQRQLQRRIGITGRRAEVIARDQIGKLNGQLTMVRQSAYGISHYRWMTSMDDRVRHLHAERHEVRFAWDDPPSDGHPGMPILCRCGAEPDIDDVLADLEREGQEELVLGAPEIEALNRAIDELGQWQPDRGLLTRLKAQAEAGLKTSKPTDSVAGSGRTRNRSVTRASRTVSKSKRTGRRGSPKGSSMVRELGSKLGRRSGAPMSAEEKARYEKLFVDAGADADWGADDYLDSRGLAASVMLTEPGVPYVVLLRSDARVVEAEEELYHIRDAAEMRRRGEEVGSDDRQIDEMEVRAKRHLLDNATELGLTAEEIADTQQQLEEYEASLNNGRGA